MLDSDVLIELRRNKPEAWNWLFSLPTRPAISIYSSLELLIGCQDGKERRETLKFLAYFPVLNASPTAQQNALDLSRWKLSHGISGLDCLIAAVALEAQETLHTFNLKHFGAVPGLTAVAPYVK